MSDEEIIKRLKRFSKDQIIEGIVKQYQGDYLVRNLLHKLENRTTEDLLNQHSAAIEEEHDAAQAYIKWGTEMSEKYGKGGMVFLRDMPPSEIERGCKLKDKWEEAQRKEETIGRKIDKILN